MKSNSSESGTLWSDRGQHQEQRARRSLGQTVGEVITGSLGAIGGRLATSQLWGGGGADGNAAAKTSYRLREVLERDRALLASSPVEAAEPSASALASARAEVTPPPAVPQDSATDLIEQMLAALPTTVWPQVPAREPPETERKTELTREPAIARDAAASAGSESVAVALPLPPVRSARQEEPPAAREPIRTRTMAILLASQGHRRRALSIYDELLQKSPDDVVLRAEVESLRNRPE